MLPQGFGRRTTVFLAIVLLFLFVEGAAHAQVFDLDHDRMHLVELDGLWRFHTGDDPDGKLGWAGPGFDDSGWALVRSDRSWDTQGYKGYAGVAWYRFSVRIPAGKSQLAILMPAIYTSYQVFANGRPIGGVGGLPPHQRAVWSPFRYFLLPVAKDHEAQTLVIAIRVWQWAIYEGGGPNGAASIGDATDVRWLERTFINNLYKYGSVKSYLVLIYLIGGVGGLALFLLRSGEREFLWFSIYQLASGLLLVVLLQLNFYPVPQIPLRVVLGLLLTAKDLGLVAFVGAVLKTSRDRAIKAAFGFAGLAFLVSAAGTLFEILSLRGIWSRSFTMSDSFDALVDVGLYSCVVYSVARAARRKVPDARFFLYSLSFYFSCILVGFVGWTAPDFGFQWLAVHSGWFTQLTDWPFPIPVISLCDFLTQCAILGILINRFARTRRDEERFKSELEAARTVQQVLIPEKIPEVAGLAIACVYKPAGQVAGDFFQVLPVKDGGALIVIGDVSGKGMPAAMAVSLLVGTVRTLAHFKDSPGEILTAMNQRMLGRSKDGFTTCLVMRLDADGSGVVANAGHLSPYVGNRELEIEGGLPLGLAGAATYEETRFVLGVGEQLTLMTDGVVEARGKGGELFGFERTAAIAGEGAERIAETAVKFGQEDDVTVLTVKRVRVGAAVGSEVLKPSMA